MNDGTVRMRMVWSPWLWIFGASLIAMGTLLLFQIPNGNGGELKLALAGAGSIGAGVVAFLASRSRGCGACGKPLVRNLYLFRHARWEDLIAAFASRSVAEIEAQMGKGPVAATAWACLECGATACVQVGLWEAGRGEILPRGDQLELDGEMAAALRDAALRSMPLT